MIGRTLVKACTLQLSGRRMWLPRNAELLSVGYQGDQLVLWARVDPRNELELRAIEVIPSEISINSEGAARGEFVGTAIHPKEPAITVHVFDYGVVAE
jgi:hypothetical protein